MVGRGGLGLPCLRVVCLRVRSLLKHPRAWDRPCPSSSRSYQFAELGRHGHFLEDASPAGILFVLGKLRCALRAERNRGLRGHWSYDLNRHIGLLSAYKGELVQLREVRLSITRIARGATPASPRDR